MTTGWSISPETHLISTHTPLAGRDSVLQVWISELAISTHTPLAGRDPVLFLVFRQVSKFLLTRPSRDVTFQPTICFTSLRISTHTPLAGRDRLPFYLAVATKISTHTPLAGRDRRLILHSPIRRISTHTPLAGRDTRWRKVSGTQGHLDRKSVV